MYAKPSPFSFHAFLQALATAETQAQVDRMEAKVKEHEHLLSMPERDQAKSTIERQRQTIRDADARKAE